jgi:hypothetical protein
MSSTATKEPTQWTDPKKWWMDLLKSVVTFAVGVVLTLLIVNRLDESRLERRFQSQLGHNLKVQAADAFRLATLEYSDAAQDAYFEMARIAKSGKKEQTFPILYDQERTIPIRRYEDDTWVRLQASFEAVKLRFASNQEIGPCLEQLEETNNKGQNLYYEAKVGWVSASTPEGRWNVGERNQGKYDELLGEFLRIRSTCVQILERSLATQL